MFNIDDIPQNIPSNIQIHNYDLSSLFIETRGHVCKLMSDIANNSGEAMGTYKSSVYYFIQLYQASRNMIDSSGKVKDWKQKDEIYRRFISMLNAGQFLPDELYRYWEYLSDDIVLAGLYKEADEDWAKNILRLLGG